MKRLFILVLFFLGYHVMLQEAIQDPKKWQKLTPQEEAVLVNKGTEKPFSGIYENFFEEGTYVCKRCHAPLYRSKDKFNAHCGWPSFDDEIPNAVERLPDKDGLRTEIICKNCKAHLGHVFTGEQFTAKNTRHCVNSVSLLFVPAAQMDAKKNLKKAYFASGCFWGTEYWMSKAVGVWQTKVGYMGGYLANPSYDLVSSGNTGHVETVEVIFDPQQISYDDLVKLFFETHDPTQTNGQGPDIGSQYLSRIFYVDEEQEKIAQKYKKILEEKGLKIATKIEIASVFYPEKKEYHQKYYAKNGKIPYCHFYIKRF